ncbi:MucR family transcriptional regulator [Komagataeibacter oboediens]|uniref:MucR family transcriptional regulator n=1 Tax=Komagataeibacter oboediens TaxID=65958 RepID=A0ABS5SRL4_9PROT|nr:MucR family transcriptional regulator [Komagataeibacter oboediens]MBL7238379.1 MucR family transcriptional regulator [Novacetimonas hansenii]MBT0676798.1 MucR family transcriptional regulator [Komagataeibacter oboediens]MBT0680094.1 MucR family transcriptional regulator [Komagataeibacter oboediens]
MTDHETRSSGADTVRELTTRIVTAYVSSHTVPADTLPGLIATVFQALGNLGQATTGTPDLVPAVPVKKSVFPDYIVCLEDGKKMKMLKRHLHTVYGLTPQQYRAKWGLPESYPMTAPSYSAQRATLAQEIGLGRTIRATPEPSDVPDAEVPVTRLPEKKRGRRPKLA